METMYQKSSNSFISGTLSSIFVVFILFFSTINYSVAQESDSAAGSIPDSSVSSDGPSLENISKNLLSSAEEMRKFQEKAHKDEIFGYVMMGLGFSVVIAIAWFTTSLARKRKKKEDEVKALRHQHTAKHKPHHPRR